MSPSASRIDFVLSALALSLVALWFWLDRPSNPLSEDPFHPFLNLHSHELESLTVSLPPTRTLVRRSPEANAGPRFLPEHSDDPPLDPAQLDRLVTRLASLEVLREVPAPESSTEFGITPKSWTLSVLAGGIKAELTLGRESRGSFGGRYGVLRTQGKTRMVVLAPTAESLLEVTPESLIDHRVTSLIPSDIARLTLISGKSSLTIRQADSGRYSYELGGVEHYADRATVDSLLLTTTQLAVASYLPRDLHASPLEFAEQSIRLESVEPDTSLTLSWSTVPKPCPGHPSTFMVSLSEPHRPQRVGCVPLDFLKERPNALPSLDDPHLFFLRYDEVEELAGKRPSQALTLERQGAVFRLVLPESREITLEAGNGWLKSLTTATGRPKGRCEPERKPFDFELTLRSGLVGRAGPMRDTVTLGPLDSLGTRLACRGDGTLLEIDAPFASLFELDPSQLAPLDLLHEASRRITEIRIRNADGEQQLLPDSAGHLRLVVPQLPGDAASIESLAEQLGELAAERWVRRAEFARQLSAPPTAVLRWTVSPEPSPPEPEAAPAEEPRQRKDATSTQAHVLSVYDDGRGGAIAQLDRLPTPFVLDARTVDLTRGLLAYRGSFRLTEGDDMVTLSREKDPIRCERSRTGITCSSLTEGRVLDPSRSNALLESLETLDAQRVARQPSPEVAAQVTLSVGKRGQPPRFTLRLWQPSPETSEGIWLGRAETQPYLYTFPASEVAPLLHAWARTPEHETN